MIWLFYNNYEVRVYIFSSLSESSTVGIVRETTQLKSHHFTWILADNLDEVVCQFCVCVFKRQLFQSMKRAFRSKKSVSNKQMFIQLGKVLLSLEKGKQNNAMYGFKFYAD